MMYPAGEETAQVLTVTVYASADETVWVQAIVEVRQKEDGSQEETDDGEDSPDGGEEESDNGKDGSDDVQEQPGDYCLRCWHFQEALPPCPCL